MVLQRTSGSCEGGNAEKMEDGLGAAPLIAGFSGVRR